MIQILSKSNGLPTKEFNDGQLFLPDVIDPVYLV